MKKGSMASTKNMSAALRTERTTSQEVLTFVRIGDGVGIDGLSLSVRQRGQVPLVLTGGTGPSKRPFMNPTLSF